MAHHRLAGGPTLAALLHYTVCFASDNNVCYSIGLFSVDHSFSFPRGHPQNVETYCCAEALPPACLRRPPERNN